MMICPKCGKDIPDGSSFCNFCGNAVAEDLTAEREEPKRPVQVAEYTPYHVNPVAAKLLPVIRSDMFLFVCILYTVSVAVRALLLDFTIIGILLTVFLWILYSKGRKNVVDAAQLRNLSGTIFASYVINWIGWIALLLLAVLLFALLGTGPVLTGFFTTVLRSIEELPNISSSAREAIGVLLGNGVISIILVVLSAILVFTAVAGILLNIFGVRTIHRFTKSLAGNVATGAGELVHTGRAGTWLIVFGILSGISALASLSFIRIIPGGAKCAALIMLGLMVKRTFSEN